MAVASLNVSFSVLTKVDIVHTDFMFCSFVVDVLGRYK